MKKQIAVATAAFRAGYEVGVGHGLEGLGQAAVSMTDKISPLLHSYRDHWRRVSEEVVGRAATERIVGEVKAALDAETRDRVEQYREMAASIGIDFDELLRSLGVQAPVQ